ncbi:MAG: hypothetical protein HQL07_11765 [Nitrospirae bacterium]|nr:hypothetical protein [Magnetococcales bacterium]
MLHNGYGVDLSDDAPVWVFCPAGERPVFHCYREPDSKRDAVLCGLSGGTMVFRIAHLPFTQKGQILAVLPQDLADTQIASVDDPVFAWDLESEGETNRIFYAAVARESVNQSFTSLPTKIGTSSGMVIAELGLWPLLAWSGLLPNTGKIVVLDASRNPYALYLINNQRLYDFHLVSPSAQKGGIDSILEELAWLINAMQVENSENVPLFCLGETHDFWEKLRGVVTGYSFRIVALHELDGSVAQWSWGRAAGLALEMANGSGYLSRFLLNKSGAEIWSELWSLWKVFMILSAFSLGLWATIQGWRTMQLITSVQWSKQRMEQVLKETLPPSSVVVNPVLQLQQALHRFSASANGAKRFINWIELIQLKVERQTGVQWLGCQYEETGVHLLGEVPSYDHLEKIRKGLAELQGIATVTIEEASILPESKRVRFKLSLS